MLPKNAKNYIMLFDNLTSKIISSPIGKVSVSHVIEGKVRRDCDWFTQIVIDLKLVTL